MRKHPALILSFIATTSLCLLAGTVSAGTSVNLERATHFTTAEGSDIILNPGMYSLEAAEEWIRVLSGERYDAILLEAGKSVHEEELQEPLAISIPGQSGEREDSHIFMVLLPGGKSLEAEGTYSGVRSRSARKISRARRLAAIKAAKERARRQQAQLTQQRTKAQGQAPAITKYSPRGKNFAGQTITFEGLNLRPADFIAQLGQSRPTLLPIQGRGSTSRKITVVVPASAVTNGSPLIVRYKGGQSKTLESNYRVYRRPTITGMRVLEGPYIGVPSRIQLTISNYQGLEGQPVTLKSSQCWTLGTTGPKLPSRGRTGTVTFPITFSPRGNVASLPGSTTTQRLLALSRKRCPLELSLSRPISASIPTGKSVVLPRVWARTISKTWDLTTHTTPSGKKFKGTATSPLGICGPVSVGTAGTFPVGVVKHNHDLSFQLRNGLVNSSCRFQTTPRLKLKPGWVLTNVDWKFEKDTFCHPGTIHTEFSPGRWGFEPPLNPKYLDRIKINATCVVDSKNRAKNSHVFRGTLRAVTLVGPYGQPWTMAFE